MRKILVALAVMGLLVAAAPAASATEGFCGITWGSLSKGAEPMVASQIVDMRFGRHQCFDRMVIDLDGDAPGYRVEYVPQVVQDGSGKVVPLRGAAKLQVVTLAPMYDEQGHSITPTYECDLYGIVDGFKTFREAKCAGSFEGQTTFGLGVRARLPFRAFVLDGPGDGSRLVVDVAHRWS
jgi:hypothetical protein